jgi:drug/metabolite transporter (DMT)-like permease
MLRTRFTPLDFALYAAVIVAWGFSWIAMHYQVGVVAPEVSVVWRFLLAAPIMFALAWARGERLRFGPRDHLAFLGLGIALFCTNFALFYYGAKWIASGLLAVIFSLASVINVWLGALVLGAPVDRRVALGGALAAAWPRCSLHRSPARSLIPKCCSAWRSASAARWPSVSAT